MKLKDIVSSEEIPILLSIRENYFNEIIRGEKKYEYRKVFRKEESKAIIYISKTKKSIVGVIEFDKPIIDTSENIAFMADKIGESDYTSMIDYLGMGKSGYAVPIKNVYLFEKECTLKELSDRLIKFNAPQSYTMLRENNKLLDYLLDKDLRMIG